MDHSPPLEVGLSASLPERAGWPPIQVVSLGLSFREIDLEMMRALAARVADLAGGGTTILVIACTPVDLRILQFFGSLLPGKSIRFLDTRASRTEFYRPAGFEWLGIDDKFDAVVSLSLPGLYLLDAKYVRTFFGRTRFLVLPFAPEARHEDSDLVLPPNHPIVFNGWPWAGHDRARPTVRALLQHLAYFPAPQIQGNHHCRLVERATWNLDPGERFFPFGSFDQAALDTHFDAQILGIDNEHFAITHQTLDAASLARHPEVRFVYLIRDPRDIMVSLHQRLFHAAGDKDPPQITGLSQEEGLLRIAEGFDYVGRRRAFLHRQPPVETMAGWFLEAQSLPNVFVLRFEDVRLRPRETYLRLFAWLAKGRDALAPLDEETLASYIAQGTFEHQSGGKRKDGEAEPPTEISPTSPFRKGAVGDWKNHFTPRVKDFVKGRAGDLLVALGYERDLDW